MIAGFIWLWLMTSSSTEQTCHDYVWIFLPFCILNIVQRLTQRIKGNNEQDEDMKKLYILFKITFKHFVIITVEQIALSVQDLVDSGVLYSWPMSLEWCNEIYLSSFLKNIK